jgi:hypothetical protein
VLPHKREQSRWASDISQNRPQFTPHKWMYFFACSTFKYLLPERSTGCDTTVDVFGRMKFIGRLHPSISTAPPSTLPSLAYHPHSRPPSLFIFTLVSRTRARERERECVSLSCHHPHSKPQVDLLTHELERVLVGPVGRVLLTQRLSCPTTFVAVKHTPLSFVCSSLLECLPEAPLQCRAVI